MKRLHGLDYLRGLSAFGIMFFHYFTWSLGKFEADSFLERFGTYGVSVFYILSGITLYYVYYDRMDLKINDILSFYKKRVLRIFPLLWIVTILAIIISGKLPDLVNLVLNLSGLFGFVRWDKSFSPGVWSIGNELVFYAFFPFFLFFTKYNKLLMFLLSAIIFLFYLYFAFYQLNPGISLSNQWRIYINPLNQVFLFLSGFLLSHFFLRKDYKQFYNYLLILVGLLIFIGFPAYGDRISIVVGLSRLVFTFSCILICLGFFKIQFGDVKFLHKPLVIFGEISYSIYLIHPLVYKIISIKVHNPLYLIPVSVCISIIVAYLVYNYFEKYFMNLGKLKKV